MRVLYGVTGEGLGHAMRASVVADHLVRRGHRVKLAASGRAASLLARRFDVLPVAGLSLRYARGGVARTRTVLRIARGAPQALQYNLRLVVRDVAAFDPEVCLSDFDSFAHLSGLLLERPVVSLDHQHVIDRCEHAVTIERALGRDLVLARAVVRAKMPGCHHYIVSSFFAPPLEARCTGDTTLVGPLLRPAILDQPTRHDDHVLVYQTSAENERLLRVLRRFPERRFVVYGFDRCERIGNVQLRAFDEARFVADLASAHAVITNGGHTAISEALHFGKPLLAIPLQRQGEQLLNAAYLEWRGLGNMAPRASVSALRRFLRRADDQPRTRRIAPGNAAALARLDHVMGQLRP